MSIIYSLNEKTEGFWFHELFGMRSEILKTAHDLPFCAGQANTSGGTGLK